MPPVSPNMMSRAQAEEIIRNGGSVLYDGRVIHTLDLLDMIFPSAEELIDASDPVATNEALGALHDQRAALDKRAERLRARMQALARPADETTPKKGQLPKGMKAPSPEQPAAPSPAAHGDVQLPEPPKEPSKAKRAPRRGKAAKAKKS
jgi:hypothetical protein